jgi:hypothetical protein
MGWVAVVVATRVVVAVVAARIVVVASLCFVVVAACVVVAEPSHADVQMESLLQWLPPALHQPHFERQCEGSSHRAPVQAPRGRKVLVVASFCFVVVAASVVVAEPSHADVQVESLLQ